jgi:hypothetical protein
MGVDFSTLADYLRVFLPGAVSSVPLKVVASPNLTAGKGWLS